MRRCLPILTLSVVLAGGPSALWALAACSEPCERASVTSPHSDAGEHAGCSGPVLSACCCDDDVQVPAPPPSPSLDQTLTNPLTPVFAAWDLVGQARNPSGVRLRTAPRHGFHSADLSTLLSTFLI